MRSCVICLPPESIDDDIVLMHEMIHLHEFVINEQPMFFHDMLLWALYTDLRKKIPNLDFIISDHAHALTSSSIYWRGGTRAVTKDVYPACPAGGQEVAFESSPHDQMVSL